MAESKKNKHLTHEDRCEIEECLGKRMTFKSISALIAKDPTTVSYEVKHHRTEHRNSFTTSDEPCPLLLKAPFVCNGCPKKHSASCRHVRFVYRAVSAQKEYRELLSDSREGIPLNKQEFYDDDRIISDGIARGQHLYQIIAVNQDVLSASQSSIYRYFQKGYLSASVIDLPRAVKFKPRRSRRDEYVPSGIRVGRSYDDFLLYKEQNNLERHVELDTVIGRIGGKVILTVHFSSCNFMTGLLLDNKTAAAAAAAFSGLKDRLRTDFSVSALFDVLLADNGGEFSDVFSFENDPDGNREIHMFFCDPMTPSQKPRIEKNHTLLRDILPKGSSFDDLTQDSVNLIFSHVNSVCRPLYGGKSAYDLFSFLYSEQAARALGIVRIPAADVIQSPLLLKNLADLNLNL